MKHNDLVKVICLALGLFYAGAAMVEPHFIPVAILFGLVSFSIDLDKANKSPR